MTTFKFDIGKLDSTTDFSLWQVKMNGILIQSSLHSALDTKNKSIEKMTDKEWNDLDMKALITIQLCLTDGVLRECLSENMAGVFG